MPKRTVAPSSEADKSEKKNSAYYMRRKRGALTDAGFVPVEVFVLPENKPLLRQIEMRLRQPAKAGTFNTEMTPRMTTSQQLTTESLHQALLDWQGRAERQDMTITLVQGADPSIKAEMADYNNLPIYIAVEGEQVVVDTVLVHLDSVIDPPAFNDAVLRSRSMFPLSSIGIESMPNGETVYNIFGALSASSSVSNVATEIYTLAENALRAIEAFTGFISSDE